MQTSKLSSTAGIIIFFEGCPQIKQSFGINLSNMNCISLALTLKQVTS